MFHVEQKGWTKGASTEFPRIVSRETQRGFFGV